MPAPTYLGRSAQFSMEEGSATWRNGERMIKRNISGRMLQTEDPLKLPKLLYYNVMGKLCGE